MTIDFSDLDITLPEINNVYPPPPPVPMGDVTVPSETILGMFMEVAQGAMSGLKAGAGEVAYKGSLPFAWMSGKTEFETLRDYRDQAWIDSGLDGTKTQYYTQVSANIGVGAGYGALTTGVVVRAIGNKTLTMPQWDAINKSFPGFANKSAYEKGIALIKEQGFFRAIIPTGEGALLGMTTKYPKWHNHLPSVETVVGGAAIVYTVYNNVWLPIWNMTDPTYTPPTIDVEKSQSD